MNRKTSWTPQYDELLRKIKEKVTGNNWILISQEFNQVTTGRKRSPKQCRDRFVNYLSVQKGEIDSGNNWTLSEVHLLFNSVKESGFKWSEIAKNCVGKSEKSLKNKFNNQIRKVVRILNKALFQARGKTCKPVKFDSVLRILRFDEQDWQNNPEINSKCQQIRSKVLDLGRCISLNDTGEGYLDLVDEIHQFNIAIRVYIMRNFNLHQRKSKTKGKSMSAKLTAQTSDSQSGSQQESSNKKTTKRQTLAKKYGTELEIEEDKNQQMFFDPDANQSALINLQESNPRHNLPRNVKFPDLYGEQEQIDSGKMFVFN